MAHVSWHDQLFGLRDATDRALAALRDVEDWAWKNVVASDVLPHRWPDPFVAGVTH